MLLWGGKSPHMELVDDCVSPESGAASDSVGDDQILLELSWFVAESRDAKPVKNIRIFLYFTNWKIYLTIYTCFIM